MSFTIKDATRSGVLALIGMFGKSGSGKTMSALLLMRGLIGPKGRLVLIDSESGRGSLFSDLIPGGYKVLDLEPPFSPERYQEAFETAEAQADGVVVDSLTHEHNGDGGVLDMQEAELNRMAGDNYGKREACKMASWIKPKMAHKKFIQRLLRCKVPLVCCLRGEEKTHMIKGDDGKNKVITDPFSSPLFDPRFIFEMLVNLETIAKEGKGGFIIPRKITHPQVAPLLPGLNEQIGMKHGAALAAWCNGTATATPAKTDTKALLGELRTMTEGLHGWRKGMSAKAWSAAKAALQSWLSTELSIATHLDDMSPEELKLTIDRVRTKMTEQPLTEELI